MSTASTSSSSAQTIRLAEWGPDVTGRTRGAEVRERIEAEATDVVFDCAGVESMSPSFADELFGKLATEDPRPHISVVNAGADIISAIRFAVRQRTTA